MRSTSSCSTRNDYAQYTQQSQEPQKYSEVSMINHNKALKGKQREQPLNHYSGACEIASQTKVEVLSQGDYSDGQAVQSTPALATVEAKDDLQDYHQQSKTSSRHHSRRISASNSLNVQHNRQSQSGASNQQSGQLQTVVQQT